ncbi:MAG: efflux RND transporter periplasmic adaptor subunit [Pelagimonas sp.]|uniref:efflux RND transporter periplasmic adaptor subunit n=1 Tax=Pelagimonas sp. TaxID=2073170 RepID=UPI003D6B6430
MSDQTGQRNNASKWRWVWILLAIGTLVAVGGFLAAIEDTADVSATDAGPALQLVSFRALEAGDVNASVEALSEVRPRWSAEIRAAVSGRVIEVSEAALSGQHVTAETTLFQIERTQYETAVAASELALQEARLALLRAQNKTTITRRQFERDGIQPPNELALHLPELRIAEGGIASAEAQLAAARQQLEDTTVIAPFSGIVTERMISLGQTVSPSEPMVTLVDDTRFELTVEVSRTDWDLLDHPIAGQIAVLESTSGTPLGTAIIREGGGFLDPTTRQYRIFLEVSRSENTSVLSGGFVRVILRGRTVEDTLTIPSTALTRTGHVWFIDPDDQLVRQTPDIIFRRADRIVIRVPQGEMTWRLATTPLGFFLPGQQVAPHMVEGN